MMVQSLRAVENSGSLHRCLSRLFETEDVKVIRFEIESIHENKNFTTQGIYRVFGTAEVDNGFSSWTVILKVIEPESEEKNAPSHHNYWKREALVNDSGLLLTLPPVIAVPKCYLVEEKDAGTIWIWIEEIKDDNSRPYTRDDWAFIAKQVGYLNGCFISKLPLPQQPWICRSWLRSWVNACRAYAPDPFQHYTRIGKRSDEINTIWERYIQFENGIDKYLESLNRLPRVLAHQDLSKGNMYISDTEHGRRLTLIDWQFMSISGVGEDLGKLYGVAMSQNNIPSECYRSCEELLFEQYIEGLRRAGWDGEAAVPRYGFCIATAMRSVWEVPKLMHALANNLVDPKGKEVTDLIKIIGIQLDCAEEAERIMTSAC